jgi:putative phage-type endonuclease
MIEIIDRESRELTLEEMAALRATSIGGSDAPPIKRESPFATPLEVWARKKRLIPPQAVTARMLRGLRLEPQARARYEAETGIPMPARVVKHPEIRYMHASLDGRNADVRGGTEFKAPGAEDHIEALKGNVPRKYIWQCVHNLAADPTLEWIDYFSFNPDFDGPETARIRVTRSRRLEQELLAAEKEFYRFMKTNTPPPPGPKELPWPWPKYAFYRGETMYQPNQTENPAHIARQLAELLEQAKGIALHLASASVATLPPASVGGAQPLVMNPPATGPRCPTCGDFEQPSRYPKNGKNTYCVTCFKRNKDAKR